MNSFNKDADYQDNTETNNFALIDRFMLDDKSWNKTLSMLEKSKKSIQWKDKVDKLYWRGTLSSDNNTMYS